MVSWMKLDPKKEIALLDTPTLLVQGKMDLQIQVGIILASSPIVTTRGRARVLGYSSPDAPCHAFANAGLPSPGAITKVRRAA